MRMGLFIETGAEFFYQIVGWALISLSNFFDRVIKMLHFCKAVLRLSLIDIDNHFQE